MKIRSVVLVCLFLTPVGCAYMIEKPGGTVTAPEEETESKKADASVAPILVSFLNDNKLEKGPVQKYEDPPNSGNKTPLGQVVELTTPAGYRLKTRFQELGVSLAQALSMSEDPQLQGRLLETARWVGKKRSRSEALIALAQQKNPEHWKYFREALLDNELEIQLAAVEALQIWGLPDAVPMLLDISSTTWSPILRVYSAQAALRMGNQDGRQKLLKLLTDGNWLVRAMAARYLGEMGDPEKDAELMLSRIGPEQQQNDFVLAEVAIAALNLTARKQGARPAPPGPPPPPRGIPRRRQPFELEPLVITAPRARMKTEFVDIRIDNGLTNLLEKMAEEPTETTVPEGLESFQTPTGFALVNRYTKLSILLTEGLAGTRNMGLVQTLERFARDNPNASVRAAAIIALAYDKTRYDIAVFQQALRDKTISVRFAALEALNQMGTPFVQGTLADAANNDAALILRVYAAQALLRSGDPYGRQILLRYINDPDWVVRGMAVYFLGDLGQKDDYYRVGNLLNTETDDFVISEICGAMLKLASI